MRGMTKRTIGIIVSCAMLLGTNVPAPVNAAACDDMYIVGTACELPQECLDAGAYDMMENVPAETGTVTPGDIAAEETPIDRYDAAPGMEPAETPSAADGAGEEAGLALNRAGSGENTIGNTYNIKWTFEEATKTIRFTGEDDLVYTIDNRNPFLQLCIDKRVENIIFENCKLLGQANGLFDGLNMVKKIDCSGLDTSKVTDMNGMFNGCSSLSSLDLSGLKTSGVTDMSSMFNGCSSLVSLDLSSFNTDAVKSMSRMFINCSNLTELDISGFNTGVLELATDTLKGCDKLSVIKTPGKMGQCMITLPKDFCDESGDSFFTTLSSANTGMVLREKGLVNSYIVRFDANGGTGAMAEQAIELGATQSLNVNKFTREGYVFAGWSAKADGSGKTYADGSSVSNLSSRKGSTVVLYARWAPNTYTIKFDGRGATTGSMPEMVNCNYGSKYELTANAFVKTDHSFSGWNTKADGSGDHYSNKATVESLTIQNGGTVILYAQWQKGGFAITYNLKGGENNAANPDNYDEKTNTILLKDPTKEGYAFDGWYSDPKLKSRVTEIPKGSVGDKNLYAKWKVSKYTVHFDGNGSTGSPVSGSMPDMKKRIYDKKFTLKANKFKKDGYTFTGWNTKKDGTGDYYKNKASVKNLASKADEVVTLYAQWKITEYTIAYKLNGGVVSGGDFSQNPASYTRETSTITLKNPTKTGYTFGGWYKDSKYKAKNLISKIEKGSFGKLTLYAKWTANKYTVTYDGNGASSGEMGYTTKCTYGKSCALKANKFKRDGYVFAGWNTERKGTGISCKNKEKVKYLSAAADGKVTLYAQWERVGY